jgi:hypothetical protein
MHTAVSSPVENVEIVAPKTKKPKKLSAKYEKFIVFGYWFIEQLKQQNIEVDESVLHQQLTMFSSVEEQTQYFESFFEQLKTSTKSMKALVKEHNKPPAKAKKAKKEPAAKKTNGRKKKTPEVINDKQEELVAELVAAAQNELPTELPTEVPTEVEKPKRKYSRKPKATVSEETIVANVVLETAMETIKEPLTVDKPKKTTKKQPKNTVVEDEATPAAKTPAKASTAKGTKK